MAPKFGTSGLRGLVVELTPALVADHVRAFAASCETGGRICVGRDLRPSSAAVAAETICAVRSMGLAAVDCGEVPTPALALEARARGAAAIMVTGSHIPADRNGLKFYSVKGEISKADEAAITAALGRAPPQGVEGPLEADAEVGARYVRRYLEAFGGSALAGRKIGLYAHSAVGRDHLAAILSGLGAEVVEFGRSAIFIPVDTEAVEDEAARRIAGWAREAGLDALVSADGDADRPLLADEAGRLVPGDLLGQISAQALGAQIVVTPVSSNSGVLRKGFAQVARTKIGSPYVIAAMEAAEGGRVVGYEANGGFLLGFDAQGPAGGRLSALPTRDAVLPLLLTLIAARGGPVSARIRAEPPVFTRSGRLQEIPVEISQPFLAELTANPAARAEFLKALGGEEAAVDLTDGLRIALKDGRSAHLRPSGNAPEFRFYVEAATPEAAQDLMVKGLARLQAALAAPAA